MPCAVKIIMFGLLAANAECNNYTLDVAWKRVKPVALYLLVRVLPR
jgi:hypothetical protein